MEDPRTIESGFGSGISTHAISSLEGRATAHVHDDAEWLLAHVRQHRLGQTQRAEVHRLHPGADFVLGEGFYGGVDRKARIVHQDVDLLA